MTRRRWGRKHPAEEGVGLRACDDEVREVSLYHPAVVSIVPKVVDLEKPGFEDF